MSIKKSMASNTFTQSLWESAVGKVTKARGTLDAAIGAATRPIIFKNTPIVNNKILFMTYKNTYECNPKYIAEKIIERGLPYKLVWAISPGKKVDVSEFPPQIKLVERKSYEFFHELASARIWFDNALNCEWTRFEKKPEQIYINTWHGSMGLKRIGKDEIKDPKWQAAADRVTKYTDYILSNSDFEDMVYRTTYWPETEILRVGHPRNDALFLPDEKRAAWLRRRLAREYGFDESDKLFLYAPTFRQSGSLDSFDVDFDALAEALEKRFDGTWRILMRLHFHDRRKTLFSRRDMENRMIDVTQYGDMQELLAVVDAGMTDFSSWCCDYVLTGKPCFIFATDYDDYMKSGRGMYYSFDETPFPFAQSNDQLIKNVLEFDEALYAQKRAEFLEARGCIEDGHAADHVVDIVSAIIDG